MPRNTPPEQFREFCLRCNRAKRVCFCERIKTFSTAPDGPLFAILLHPREFKRSIGTTRIVELSIEGTKVFRGSGPSLAANPKLNALLDDPGLYPVVLYPGPNASTLEAAQTSRPQGKRLLIIAIDGTWPQAKKLLRECTPLHRLPQVAFTPSDPSRYRIREQPKDFCLSTVEAVHTVLGTLGYPNDQMLEVFDWMVEYQLEAARTNDSPRRIPKEQREPRA